MADATLDVEFENWELVTNSEADIEVFSATGMKVMSGEDCTTLPLIGLPNGIYIVRAHNRNAQVTKKIYFR